MKITALVLGLLLGGEQVIQRNKEYVPVVTLLDPSKSDPYEYRWVVINSTSHDFSIVVNRSTGQVYQCLGQAIPLTDNPSKGCELVYDGPIRGGKR